MKLLIIAGGTGGHIFPAWVVAETMQKQGVLIEWMGTEIGMENKLVGDRFPMHFLPVKALRGKSMFQKLIAPFRILKSVYLAYFLIKKINPDVILGMGGYASGPGGVAAWLRRVPLVIHEQNAKAGLTNRLLSRIATSVLQAFPGAFSKNISAITVGNPVRESIHAVSHNEKKCNNKPLHVLVLGGSQGASAINVLLTTFIAQFSARNDIVVWHQTGQRDLESVQKKYASCANAVYRVAPFIEKIEEAYAWADLVICRAGALTVSEIAAAGLPSILIPYPHAADDHQYANALFLSKAGAGFVFRENELTPEKLDICLEALLSSTIQLQQMRNQARICAQPEAVLKIIERIRCAKKILSQ